LPVLNSAFCAFADIFLLTSGNELQEAVFPIWSSKNFFLSQRIPSHCWWHFRCCCLTYESPQARTNTILGELHSSCNSSLFPLWLAISCIPIQSGILACKQQICPGHFPYQPFISCHSLPLISSAWCTSSVHLKCHFLFTGMPPRIAIAFYLGHR